MLCYRDRTYCSFHTNCNAAEECDRALTPAVKAGAAKAGLPISQYPNPPKWFEPIELWTRKGRFVE